MKTRINKDNGEKLKEAIKEAEGKATARVITVPEILRSIDDLQIKLDTLMKRKDQVGTTAWIDINAQSFPSAYKYTPESTCFSAKKTSSGWFMIGIKRATCTNKEIILGLSDEQKSAIADYVADSKNW